MKPHALIVHAHPAEGSFNAALRDTAQATLQAAGWTVEISDLYAEGFGAVAGPGDVAGEPAEGRFSLLREQRRASAGGGFVPEVAREQDRLRRADFVLLQFPLWWYSVPAVLKGWFDRVLAHGFAYDDDHLFEDGLLHGRRAMVSLTTGGTAEELAADAARTGTLEDWLRPVHGGTLGFVGLKVLPPFVSYAPGSMDETSRRSELQRLAEHLGRHVGG